MALLGWFTWFDWILLCVQFLFCSCFIISLLSLLTQKRSFSISDRFQLPLRNNPPPVLLLQLFKLQSEELHRTNCAILLRQCGIELDIRWYYLWKRLLLASIAALMLSVFLLNTFQLPRNVIYMMLLLLGLLIIIWSDQYWLKLYKQARTIAITREIYAISHQLLYFSDSQLHIHTKLRKCLPFSRVLRKNLEMLLADWYHDSAEALQRFKQRIGTDEGISFAETIDSLHQHNSPEYYELLRTRLVDYKEKLELAKESRKETTSYMLFIIAGIPILYTFQVFIYPWVQEVQQLLALMN